VSPHVIALVVIVPAFGIITYLFAAATRRNHRTITEQNRLLLQQQRVIDAQSTLVQITTEALALRTTEARQLRQEMQASLPDATEDAALTFNAVVTEAIEVTREQVGA